ncbi:MAG: hypothetical protein HYV77_02275 [Candidatus Wildermuthbacteria bacterium]|nr:hypothetical protein [Candidatus Wildermuthbacteria bacterium]
MHALIKILIGIALLAGLAGWGTDAWARQGRGIGVSPAQIRVENISEWPHSVKMYITNFSAEKEWIEITLDKKSEGDIIVDPARFALEGEKRGVVLLTFGESVSRKKFEGVIKVQATRILPEGLATGTGIEIPFSVAGDKIEAKDKDSFLLAALGSIGNARGFVGLGLILLGIAAIVALLFKLAGYFAPFLRKP